MDDEQKEAFDALSDAEKKEVLEEAKTQLNSMSEEEKQAAMQGGHASGGGPLSRIRQLQNMPFGDFMCEFGGKDFFGALLERIKKYRSHIGRARLRPGRSP